MLDRAAFERVVVEANQAPSVHNAQPARWRLRKDVIEVGADLRLALPAADPNNDAIGLSCGAAVEATVLTCKARGLNTHVVDQWSHDDRHTWPRHRLVSQIYLADDGVPDALYDQLPQRFTWRAAFQSETPRLYGWSRADTTLVVDEPTRAWLADLNDAASFTILSDKAFRHELLGWMRLDPAHPRSAFDGLSRAALHMPKDIARKLRLGFGPLWPLLKVTGGAKAMVSDRDMTMTAPAIAIFHVDTKASASDAGRAYLRMWLEATRIGFAGWPMAALTDHAPTKAAIAQRLNIGSDRRLIQVLRFGHPTGDAPPRARRPLMELCDD